MAAAVAVDTRHRNKIEEACLGEMTLGSSWRLTALGHKQVTLS